MERFWWRFGVATELGQMVMVFGCEGAVVVYGSGNGGVRWRLAVIRLVEEEKVVMASTTVRRWEGSID
ncbi:hypothetical protein RHMOL_Rhmol06G0163100 [Rhododendron molle]|uniref:Uncharacterized protein n=1 Tax=Rhododendron molle TaxID=49168 RepID=A0ACC0ND32_RHOML|nr:hypothetical protein RHMOL_Rhmol06G0163100 [Rhododendron molle]